MNKKDFSLAAKAFILKDTKVLLLKRREDDVHAPGNLDIPGGRLEYSEDPYLGLKRETKEETNLNIEIIKPLDVRHFKREDGQTVTNIIFLCEIQGDNEIKLSKEHTNFEWKKVGELKEIVWLKTSIKNL